MPAPSHRTLLTLACALALLAAPAARALELSVTTTADTADATPGDGVCSTPSGCSLRAALQTANAAAGIDTILVPAGTFTLTRAGSGEDDASTGDLDVRDAVRILGAGRDLTVVDAGGLDRVFDLRADATMSGLTIRGGALAEENGGGVQVWNPNRLELRHVRVTGNDIASGSPVLDNGGGIQVVSGASLVARHVEVDGNRAQRSGGLAVGYDSNVLLDQVWIHDNEAVVAGGGLLAGGTTVLQRSLVSGNRAGNNSDAMLVGIDSTVRLENTTVSSNGEVGLASRTFGFYGGALTLENVTVAANEGFRTFDLISGTPTLTLRNTIVSNPAAGEECEAELDVVSAGYNLDSDGTCAGAGTGDVPSADPLLLALGDHGGDLHSQPPAAGSPAIDAGNPGGCTGVDGAPIARDQRGAVRPADGDGSGGARCDIGAIEYGAVPEPEAALLSAAALAALAALAKRRSAGRAP